MKSLLTILLIFLCSNSFAMRTECMETLIRVKKIVMDVHVGDAFLPYTYCWTTADEDPGEYPNDGSEGDGGGGDGPYENEDLEFRCNLNWKVEHKKTNSSSNWVVLSKGVWGKSTIRVQAKGSCPNSINYQDELEARVICSGEGLNSTSEWVELSSISDTVITQQMTVSSGQATLSHPQDSFRITLDVRFVDDRANVFNEVRAYSIYRPGYHYSVVDNFAEDQNELVTETEILRSMNCGCLNYSSGTTYGTTITAGFQGGVEVGLSELVFSLTGSSSQSLTTATTATWCDNDQRRNYVIQRRITPQVARYDRFTYDWLGTKGASSTVFVKRDLIELVPSFMHICWL